jgi:probable HAF family extracellular repeat protein
MTTHVTTSQRFTGWAAVLLIFILPPFALAPLASAQKYSITDLGTFPGGSVSQGQAVNLLGQVTGYARFANYNAHGFFWSETTGLVDLGSIRPLTNFSVGQAINSFGDVAGYSDYNELESSHAVVWSQGTIHDLGTLPGGTISQANGINDLGVVAGFSNGTGISPHAVLWNKHGSMQDLGTLPGGYYSQGLAINLEGEVAGFSNGRDGNWHGFVWNGGAGMQELPILPRGYPVSANGINDLGEVVGGSGSYAVLWHNDPNHSVKNLGTLPGASWSTAFAINNAGQVVGWSGGTAFIWSRRHGMQDLNQLIPSDCGWTLGMATSINVLGQITGEGTMGGEQHAFLLTPVSQ